MGDVMPRLGQPGRRSPATQPPRRSARRCVPRCAGRRREAGPWSSRRSGCSLQRSAVDLSRPAWTSERTRHVHPAVLGGSPCLERLNRSAGDWAPDVRGLRPGMPWQDVLAVMNSRLPDSRCRTLQRLVRATRAYVTEELLPRRRSWSRRPHGEWTTACRRC